MIIHHQKVIISPQKCALIPQNRSFNHISLTFSLTQMIYALLSKNVASLIYALLLTKFARMLRLGSVVVVVVCVCVWGKNTEK